MIDQLKIYIDRLSEDREETISCSVDPVTLDMVESELQFKDPVEMQGKAYLTKEHLVIHLSLETKALLPCSICNSMSPMPIKIQGEYYTIPLAEVRKIYDLTENIRESILVLIPPFFECGGGTCKERENLGKYLKHSDEKVADPHHFPFTELE